jgi:hypothetical protein
MRFTATMKIRDANPFIDVSPARAAGLRAAWRKPMPVLVRINGKPDKAWRINMMPRGDGGFYLYLHGAVRKASGTGVGDKVQVEVSFDAEYRPGPMHPMPPWFREALDSDPKAKKAWNALIPSRQKEILRYFSWLKSEAARQRNLKRAMEVLAGGEARFMARSWSKGT